MAQPQRQAEFFVAPSGIVLVKAPPLKPAVRRMIYERDKGRCQACRTKVKRLGNTFTLRGDPPCAVDHIFPRSRGGQNDETNLRLLCITCNSQKGAK